jgi:hypothetical protein
MSTKYFRALRFSKGIVLALACSLAVAATAQPTWRFHLAFEDGTGARDTIWLVYDSAATSAYSHWPVPIDEYDSLQATLNYGDGGFHVYLQNDMQDTTNSLAFPYSAYPLFETGNHINAINWTPPMTITWDTSLFHAPYLPYDQGEFGVATMDGLAFSAYMNNPDLEFGRYDMLISDSITVDFLWEYLFSFAVGFGPDDGVGVTPAATADHRSLLYPVPATSCLWIRSKEPLVEVQVYDAMGRMVLQENNQAPDRPLNVALLPHGTYYLLMHAPQNQVYHGIFQKVD